MKKEKRLYFFQGLVKPDVLLFGEDLPEKYFTFSEQDFKICDLLIILGTSLLVQVSSRQFRLVQVSLGWFKSV